MTNHIRTYYDHEHSLCALYQNTCPRCASVMMSLNAEAPKYNHDKYDYL